MKNYFILAVSCHLIFLHAQVGIETQNPQTQLDVNGDVTLREELRIGGTPTIIGDPGEFGQVLFSQEDSNKPVWKFVNIPFLEEGQIQLKYSYAVQDQVGIQFPTGAGDGDDFSFLGETFNSTWTLIPGLETDIEVMRLKNKVSVFLQSGVEMPNTYNAENGARYFVRYACGIFMNEKLIAIRGDQINGVNNKNAKNQEIYTLSYVLSDLEIGQYNLKVACRKVRTSSENYALAIGRTLNPGTQVANNFMLSSNLKIDVMEYILND